MRLAVVGFVAILLFAEAVVGVRDIDELKKQELQSVRPTGRKVGPSLKHFKDAVAKQVIPVSTDVIDIERNLQLTPVQTYFVPFPEENIIDTFTTIDDGVSGDIETLISIALARDNTIIWYDHWEDGFETDITNPSQSTTLILGDGNVANGAAPGVTVDADDVLQAGRNIIIENVVPVTNPADSVEFDGKDKIVATFPIAVSRGAFPVVPGSLAAGAVEVYDTDLWGLRYEIPVGPSLDLALNADPNRPNSTNAFNLTQIYLMASEDNTVVTFGANQFTLNQGDSVNFGVDVADVITATKPVQAHLFTGEINGAGSRGFEIRWYALSPREDWTSEYFTSVSSENRAATVVWLYNPNDSAISVEANIGGPFVIPPKGVVRTSRVPEGSGARFSTSGEVFYGIVQVDGDCCSAESPDGQVYDWGHPLIPSFQLTSQALVGLGYGCTNNDCTDGDGNDDTSKSVVFVMPVADATVCVDFDASGYVEPRDMSFTVGALEGIKIEDTVDEDMSGALIYAVSTGDCSAPGLPVDIAVAWGQDSSVVIDTPDEPISLDLGTVVTPFPEIEASKTVALEDTAGDGEVNLGDVLVYSILVQNALRAVIQQGAFFVRDVLPVGTTYVAGSTTYDSGPGASPLADDTTGTTPYLLDEGGLPLQANLPVDGSHVITFKVQINSIDAIESGLVEILNEGDVYANGSPDTPDDTFRTTTPVFFRPSIDIDNLAVRGPTGNCDDAVDLLRVPPAADVTYCFTITNTGDTFLDTLDVIDPVLQTRGSAFIGPIPAILAPGANFSLTIENPIGVDIFLTNNATVTATPTYSNGDPIVSLSQVTDTDPSSVQVVDTQSPTLSPTGTPTANPTSLMPAIAINNTVLLGVGGSCPGSEVVTGDLGGTVTYCLVITNTGDTNLINVTVSDPVLGFETTVPLLRPGESNPFSLVRTLTVDEVNIANVTGTPAFADLTPVPNVPAVQDSDPSEVKVLTEAPTNSPTLPPTASSPAVMIDNTVYASQNNGTSCPGSDKVVAILSTPATYCFIITNVGDTHLTDINVANPVLEGLGGVIMGTVPSVLAPGASFTVTTEDVLTADLINNATVVATPALSDGTVLSLPQVSDIDDSEVDVFTAAPTPSPSNRPTSSSPAISIDNTVYEGQQGSSSCPGVETVTAIRGTGVTYCFVIVNTGDSPLTNITVENPVLEGSGGQISGTIPNVLLPMESFTVIVEDVLEDDLTNTAVVTGTPSDTSGNPSGLPNVSDFDNSNVDVLTFAPSDGPTPSPTASSPNIDIDNTVYIGWDLGASCTGLDFVTTVVDRGVTYCFVVTNTGNAPLTNVQVSNGVLQGRGREFKGTENIPGVLNPGESFTLYLEDVILPSSLSNIARVTGTSTLTSEEVRDDDDSSVAPILPAIDIDNTVYLGHNNGQSCPGQDLVTGDLNAPVTYCLIVTNRGNSRLNDVRVVDEALGVSTTIPFLDPGASVTIIEEPSIPGDLDNVATATGTPVFPDGRSLDVPDISDSDDSGVRAIPQPDPPSPAPTSSPMIKIENTVYFGDDGGSMCPGAEMVTGNSGDVVTYCFVVTNTGPIPLNMVTVTNPVLEGMGATIIGTVDELPPGGTTTFYVVDTLTEDLTNTATVTGTPTNGGPLVSDEDDSSVEVIPPASIDIDNTVYLGHDGGASCEGEDLVTGDLNAPVTYCLVVTNTGQSRLNDVLVEDANLGFSTTIPFLLPGASSTLTLEPTIPGDLDNTATVVGKPAFSDGTLIPGASDVTDFDDSGVRVNRPPSIDIDNTVAAGTDGASSCPGEDELIGTEDQPVTYCFVVTNDGEATLNNIVVTNPVLEGMNGNIIGSVDELAPGESTTFYLLDTISANLTNTAMVTATSKESGEGVTDSDDSTVALDPPVNPEVQRTPSQEPTNVPTPCPVVQATCFDYSQTFTIFPIKDGEEEDELKEVDCEWVGKKQSRIDKYCVGDNDAVFLCRETCDLCLPGDTRASDVDDNGCSPQVPPNTQRVPTPSAAPTPVCVDSDEPVYVYDKGANPQDCEWLSLRNEREIEYNCEHVPWILEMCPLTCGVCDRLDSCRDFMSSFEPFKEKAVDCEYIAKTESRIEKYCEKRSDADEKCILTCRNCLVPPVVQQACALMIEIGCTVDATGEDCATAALTYRDNMAPEDDCDVAVTFTFNITNRPDEGREITSFAIVMNGMFRDATTSLSSFNTPTSYAMSLDLDFCTGGTITTEAEANSMMDCDVVDELIIEVPTNSPTNAPTVGPTNGPSDDPTVAPTSDPTNDPSNAPTNEPTNAPTNEPTNAPTNEPTNEPTNAPTNEPTNDPTNEPTNEPTLMPTPTRGEPTVSPTPPPPTLNPTPEPSSGPTSAPTDAPSSEPSSAPSSDPSAAPSSEPSSAPSSSPSNAPTSFDICTISLTVDCTVPVTTTQQFSPTEECRERPTAMSFQFKGGGCGESNNDQEGKHECTDFIGGPVTSGSANIFITDKDGETEYFNGVVELNEVFALNTGNEKVDSDMSVTISVGGSILQRFQFHSSCSRSLFLNNVFGALRLVSFTNSKQGTVTAAAASQAQQAPSTTTCDAAPLSTSTTECMKRPSQMAFRYIGGGCGQTNNFQEGKAECTDRNGGPPTSGSATLVIRPSKSSNTVYFNGNVEVGERFDLINTGGRVESDMTVTVTAANGGSQSVEFHSSCSRDLFLLDKFGAIQLVGFTNDEQGVVTGESDLTATFTYTVTNLGDVDADLELTAVRSNGTPLSVEGKFDGNGTFVATEVASITFTGDAASLATTAEVTGTTASGKNCTAVQLFEIPISPVVQQSTKCNKRPTEMTFRFIGGNCAQNMNDQRGKYECRDTAAPITMGSAEIVVTGKGTPYFDGVVNIGDNFSIDTRGDTVESDMEVQIRAVGSNVVHQDMEFHTSCSRDLFINDVFGGLRLVGFTNEKQGRVGSP